MDLAIVDWLDTHAGAISALATVVLVLITAVYVLVTYLLVREQRRQAQRPDVVHEWAYGEGVNADLRFRNVGTGTAFELTVLLGPGEGVSVAMEKLGDAASLPPREVLDWPIRPADGEPHFPAGTLPVTYTYVDSGSERVFFSTVLLEFGDGGEDQAITDAGSVSKDLSRRQVKRLGARAQKAWKRPWFIWERRGEDMTELVVNPHVRDALRAELATEVEALRAWSRQMEALRNRV